MPTARQGATLSVRSGQTATTNNRFYDKNLNQSGKEQAEGQFGYIYNKASTEGVNSLSTQDKDYLYKYATPDELERFSAGGGGGGGGSGGGMSTNDLSKLYQDALGSASTGSSGKSHQETLAELRAVSDLDLEKQRQQSQLSREEQEANTALNYKARAGEKEQDFRYTEALRNSDRQAAISSFRR